jgi:hypothetical protein
MDSGFSVFAGFTSAEWTLAFSRLMDAETAAETVASLFEQIADEGSNGYSLPVEVWAMLAYVSEDGQERVAELVRHYPEEFRALIWARLEGERSLEAS